MNKKTIEANPARHPIQVVSRRTGLSNDVIRVWERRYEVVSPERQQTGRRLYSDADIERLQLLQRATSAGRRISEVATLDNKTLSTLVDEDRNNKHPISSGEASGSGANTFVNEALQQILAMDADKLLHVLVRAASELPLLIFLEQVVGELLRKVGELWKNGAMRVGHEHMASAVIQRYLAGMLGRERSMGPLILMTTPAGQRHEMGALMAAIIAESEGWRVLYLGADMPAAEIAAAATQARASLVGLSIQSRGDENMLAEELKQLRMALPDSIPLIVGGTAIKYYEQLLQDIEAFTSSDLASYIDTLSSV